jgi:hypothetical protein
MCASESHPNPKPSFAATRANWKAYDAPLATKVRLTLANNWFKVRNRQNCCGNYGQPGC